MGLFKRLLTIESIDPRDQRRRELLNSLILLSIAITILIDIFTLVVSFFTHIQPARIGDKPFIYISSAVILPAFLGIFFMNRRINNRVPGLIFLIVLTGVLYFTDLPEEIVAGRSLALFAMPIVLSSFLLFPAASFLVAIIVFVSLSVIRISMNGFPEIPAMSVYFLLAFISWIGSRNLNAASEKLRESNKQLESEMAKLREKETDVEQNRLRAQAILENTLNSVFLVDDKETIVDANPAASQLTGYRREDLIGSSIRNLIADLTDKMKILASEQLFASDKLKGSMRLRHVCGKIINTDFIAVRGILPALNLIVVWDISERIESEKAQRESRELRLKTLDSIKAAIFIIEAKNGTIIEVNKSACEIFGYEKDELLGVTTEVLHINPASFETFSAHGRVAIERKGFMSDFQYRMKKKNGTFFPTEHTMSPLVNELGETTGWVSVIRDITDRKRLEAQLFHSQKMEALGRLAGGITHDFNNLLTTIFGYCEIGKMSAGTDDGTLECFTEIKRAAERAAGLTGQLLTFSRKQVLSPRILDINSLILNMKKLLARLIVENVSIEYMLTEQTDPIKADPVQIEQIIVNLIVNACDAMRSGGSIIMETKNCFLDESYSEIHPEIEAGNYVMLGVSDSGCGMDEHTLKKIFDPFFTTKGYGKGTGLSLAMVFGIVKQSAGHIHVYSELDRGTTFKIYFPKEETPDLALEIAASKKGKSLLGTERILLIEDDESLRKVVVRTLKKYGYDVEEARTGDDALSLGVGPGKKRFDLVITDVIMPGISGKEAADKLLALYPDLKVIFISGYTDNVIVNHGISCNEKAFLQKPFSPDDIARKVREMLDAGKSEKDDNG